MDYGNITSLPPGTATFTWIEWIYITTFTSGRALMFKNGGDGNGGPRFMLNGTTELSSLFSCDTTDANYISNNASLALNTWYFVAMTYDFNAVQNLHLYKGTLTSPVVELTYAGGGTNCVGTTKTSTKNLVVGNHSNAVKTISFQGRIALAGHWNRVLTLQEIKDQQYNPHPTSGCLLFTNLGYNGSTTTAPDLSGNGNTGTVTGATFSDDPPLRHNNIQGNSLLQGNSKLY